MQDAAKPVSYSGNPGHDGAMFRAPSSRVEAALRRTGGAEGFSLYDSVSVVSNRRAFAALEAGPES
jgi:hypothetical protein